MAEGDNTQPGFDFGEDAAFLQEFARIIQAGGGEAAPVATKYIGVPDTYKSPVNISDEEWQRLQYEYSLPGRQAVGRLPQYEQGAELTPGSWSLEDRVGLQFDMVRAGLLSPGKYDPGSWDSTSRNAFKELLTQANISGRSWEETLGERIAIGDQIGGYEKGPSGPSRAPFAARVTSAEDIKTAADEVSRQTIGRRLDPYAQGSADQLAAEYQGVEVAGQRAAYDAAASGGVIEDPESFETFAKRRVTEMAPVEAKAKSLSDVYGMFVNMLGGPR